MNVLIIEDHPLIRSGLQQLLSQANSQVAVQYAGTFPEGTYLLERERFDLLILDIDIPGGQNIRMIESVRSRQPEIKILVHSGYDENVYAIPFLQAGADGYLPKTSSPEEFIVAYQAVMNNGKYTSPVIQQTILTNLAKHGQKQKNPLSTLSKKEMVVMHLLMEGKWTKEIAAILEVKENTVSTYKRRIYDKLEVSDEIQLARKASLLKG
ncbi:response regulator transcription factor [Dyadobacter sp. CY345]|uniref:response regulator transcription factor n=1 Tax=Dyadobacter sp. CY345 TaxID=2909335 RepID=UPI001F2DD193|nr:response regulator transcription factor [Dyadobacter sp. CY345]MCF2445029.1 response regulator transcription factor [Dyadobacter sp. CY345]